MKKKIQTCGSCAEMGTCEKLAAITGNNPDAVKIYERYGWEFLCMAHEDGSGNETRIYIHR